MVYEIQAALDFLEVLQASALGKRSDKWTTAMERVRKLKYVKDAWIDHMCIIEVHTETANARVAEGRIANVIEKATRIINSYKPKES